MTAPSVPAQPLHGLFVGAGQFARIQLAAWQSVSGVRFLGLCDRSLEPAEALAREFDIPRVGTALKPMLEELKPDFVDICTAVETHAECACVAAAAGVAVLCQKPLTPSLEESRAMVSACEAHGVRLMANENWRWQPWWREIHRLERSGDLGQLVGVHLFLRPGDGWGPEPYRQQPFFRNLEKFLLFETGCHYFDTMRFLCGEVDTVYCHTRHLNSAIRGEDAAHAVCCHVNGVVSIFDGNRAVATAAERPAANGWAVIEGSDASLRLAADGSLWLTPRGKPERRHEFTVTTGYRGGSAVAAQAHFVAGLRHKAPFETEGRDYLKTEALVAAAYRSAESGQTEKPADFLR